MKERLQLMMLDLGLPIDKVNEIMRKVEMYATQKEGLALMKLNGFIKTKN